VVQLNVGVDTNFSLFNVVFWSRLIFSYYVVFGQQH